MTITFTGSRAGMTPRQDEGVNFLYDELNLHRLVNGCCHGSDRRAFALALGKCNQFHFFPSNPEQVRWAVDVIARHSGLRFDLNSTMPPLARNRKMVDLAPVLIATPAQMEEIMRSGTWMTIRYARRMEKQVYIVYPDGSIKQEN